MSDTFTPNRKLYSPLVSGETPWMLDCIEYDSNEDQYAGWNPSDKTVGTLGGFFKTVASIPDGGVQIFGGIGTAAGPGSGGTLEFGVWKHADWSNELRPYIIQKRQNGSWQIHYGDSELDEDTWYGMMFGVDEGAGTTTARILHSGGVTTQSLTDKNGEGQDDRWINLMNASGTPRMLIAARYMDGVYTYPSVVPTRCAMMFYDQEVTSAAEFAEMKTPVNHYIVDPTLWSWYDLTNRTNRIWSPLSGGSGTMENKFGGVAHGALNGTPTTETETAIIGALL